MLIFKSFNVEIEVWIKSFVLSTYSFYRPRLSLSHEEFSELDQGEDVFHRVILRYIILFYFFKIIWQSLCFFICKIGMLISYSSWEHLVQHCPIEIKCKPYIINVLRATFIKKWKLKIHGTLIYLPNIFKLFQRVINIFKLLGAFTFLFSSQVFQIRCILHLQYLFPD